MQQELNWQICKHPYLLVKDESYEVMVNIDDDQFSKHLLFWYTYTGDQKMGGPNLSVDHFDAIVSFFNDIDSKQVNCDGRNYTGVRLIGDGGGGGGGC